MITRVRAVGLASAIVLSAMAAANSVAGATGVNSGPAVVVSSADPGESRRDAGGSQTPFSLRLPAGSSCPGDSTNDNFRVQSFLVPATDDPATLTYRSLSPQVPGGYALYAVDTTPFIQKQTAERTAPGQPGAIIDIPNFTFSVFPPGRLPPGRYHVGIACSLDNNTVKYWMTDVLLTSAPADQPAHLRWAVADPPVKRHNNVRLAVVLVGTAALAVVAGVWLSERRSMAAKVRAPGGAR